MRLKEKGLRSRIHRRGARNRPLSERQKSANTTRSKVRGALDHSFKIKMMRNGDWYESVRMWVMLVGDVSVKKTPIINVATNALMRFQVKQIKEYGQEYAEYKKQLAQWDKKSGDPEPEKPLPPPRYIASDSTVEKLAEILARSPRGILVKRDELAGWLGSMEKYGGGKAANSDRAFWLEAYNSGSYVVDRIARGTLAVENLSASILGGIQPDKLAEIHGLTNDGLLQREYLQAGYRSAAGVRHAPAAVRASAEARLAWRPPPLRWLPAAVHSDAYCAKRLAGSPPAVRITPWSSSSLGTKPLPPHVGHCRSSSVPFSMTPSPLQSGQVFIRASCGHSGESVKPR